MTDIHNMTEAQLLHLLTDLLLRRSSVTGEQAFGTTEDDIEPFMDRALAGNDEFWDIVTQVAKLTNTQPVTFGHRLASSAEREANTQRTSFGRACKVVRCPVTRLWGIKFSL